MRSLVYFQSGGPTAVINCSLYGVIAEAFKSNEIGGVYGSIHGVEGLIEDNLADLRREDLEEIELLKQTPGASLLSSRKKLPGEEDPLFAKIVQTIDRHDIGYVLVNGGNDSMDTCMRLDEFFRKSGRDVKVLGIPKTIDNDLVVTDHCLGYPSAARHVMNLVKMAVLDAKAYSAGKVILIEIMGRNAGWLTASVDLLPEGERPDLIFLPEMEFDQERFLYEVREIYQRKGHVVCCVSEGLNLPRRNTGGVDAFGHAALEGVSFHLSEMIHERLGYGTRVMDLSLAQRADPYLVSRSDREEAIAAGKYAVRMALEGHSGEMVAMRRVPSDRYEVEWFLAPVKDIANRERKFPKSWLLSEMELSESFREYLRPLVARSVQVINENGIFQSARLRLERAK